MVLDPAKGTVNEILSAHTQCLQLYGFFRTQPSNTEYGNGAGSYRERSYIIASYLPAISTVQKRHTLVLVSPPPCVPLFSFSPGGFDYAAVGPFTLVFEPGITQITFEVPLVNDTVFEITESLNATLSFPDGIASPRVSIAQETTQITILDDDGE